MLVVVVLCAINLLNFYDRQAPGALVEPMRREFGLSDTDIGLMDSLFIWVYALVGVPLGGAADQLSRKKLLTAGVTIWSDLPQRLASPPASRSSCSRGWVSASARRSVGRSGPAGSAICFRPNAAPVFKPG